MRWAIKHIPSGKFYYEDEGGVFLVDENGAFISWGNKPDADEMLGYILMGENDEGLIYTENGDFPPSEFEVSEI